MAGIVQSGKWMPCLTEEDHSTSYLGLYRPPPWTMPGCPEFSRQAENPYFCIKFSDFYMLASDLKSIDTMEFKQYTYNIYLVSLQTANLQ